MLLDLRIQHANLHDGPRGSRLIQVIFVYGYHKGGKRREQCDCHHQLDQREATATALSPLARG